MNDQKPCEFSEFDVTKKTAFPKLKTAGAASQSGKHSPSEKTARKSSGGKSPAGERLQKVLAAAGLGSRRGCEELILAGRVQVDGQTVCQLGTRVDPQRQSIHVDGTPLPQPRLVYYALHKPQGVVSTNRDPAGRPRVIDLIPSEERLFCVGRLDVSSEGLMLLTNDGELAHQLAHPRFGVEKTYQVEAAGHLDPNDLARLRRGVHLAEGLARVERIFIRRRNKRSTILEVTLKEGKNREIRRLLAAVGHKALRLRRLAIGPLRLGELPAGAHRALSAQEVKRLSHASTEPNRQKKKTGSSKKPAAQEKSKPKSRQRKKRGRSPHG